jgi:hypothetical protein
MISILKAAAAALLYVASTILGCSSPRDWLQSTLDKKKKHHAEKHLFYILYAFKEKFLEIHCI